MSYRCNPAEDTHVIPYRELGHGPRTTDEPTRDSALLIDATMKTAMPPLALPKREYMENAKVLWDKLGLPPLKPEMPWFGYSLGDWTDEWEANALHATGGNWMDRSESYRQRRRRDVVPNTPTRVAHKADD
jgi:4-hydroxy-3-polyprenylbenzoate decarboxylase